MKLLNVFRSSILILIVCGGLIPQLSAANRSVTLDGEWQFSQATDTSGKAISPKWLPAEEPGDVHLDLLRNKAIPRPFYRDNETKLQWIENADWKYRTTTIIGPDLLNHENIDLVFDGLDTCARVSVNGHLVLTSDNMFRNYRVSVKSYMKPGVNQIEVYFPSPIRCAAKIADQDPWRPQTHTQKKYYIRKAAYEYGWDWAPKFVTSGIWRPAHLEAWDSARISDLNLRQLDVAKSVAHVLAEVEVTSATDAPANVSVSYRLANQQATASTHTQLHPGVNHVDLLFTIDHPELWYPAGYGSQPLYAFHSEVSTDGAVQDIRDVRTGMRSAVLRREPDQWGRSFEFVVNGIPIFAKGANIVPYDSFPNRVTAEQMRSILQSAKDANMNMLRMWGGGYYETPEFYEICDELGIMVWQDFMFGNPWQPGTYSFKQNVAREVEDQVKRLRNHPSIVLWCGNNEQESNFTQDTRNVTPAAKVQMWQDYLTVFSGIIPAEIERYDPATAYWPSTPSADYEETKAKNYMELEDGDDAAGNYESGDAHDYSIWDSPASLPKRPFSTEEDRHYRFVSEYGFQSFPDMRTIDAFTLPQDRTSLGTPVMMSHQKAVAGPGTVNGYPTIHAYMLQYYGEPKDLPSLVYASQIVQAEYTKVVAEHLRRERPRSMGSLFWQLNDCWPVISSSSIDYYGHWKALQYYARRFYAPLLVSPRVVDGNLVVHVVSDKIAAMPANLRVRIVKLDGSVVLEKAKAISIPALSSQVEMQIPVDSFSKMNGVDLANVFAATDLTVDGKQVSSNIIYFVPTKQIHLLLANIQSRITGSDGAYVLHLSSKVLARSVYVSFGDEKAEVSDNFFDLLPERLSILASAAARVPIS